MSNPKVVSAVNAPTVPKHTFWRSLVAVSWSFLGVRKSSEFQEDVAQVKPLQLLAVGFVSALLFVIGLIVLVNWVVRV